MMKTEPIVVPGTTVHEDLVALRRVVRKSLGEMDRRP